RLPGPGPGAARKRPGAPTARGAGRATRAWAGCPPGSSRTCFFPVFACRLLRRVSRELQLGPHFGRQDLAIGAGRAPVQGAEGAAALAHRAPALVMRAAGRATPRAIGRR